MQKKDKGLTQSISLTAGLLLAFFIPGKVKADFPASYTLRTITIASTGAMEPMVGKPYPYLRLLKWLTPTTDASLIYRYITLEPGATFNAKALLFIQKRLIALPYFSTVSVRRKGVEGGSATILSDLLVQTKDRFPITVDMSLDEGPLLTITHHNAWGYGHGLSHQLFLKTRWGYGLAYELPKLHGNYFFGGQCYKQIGNAYGNSYKFNYQNLWVGKLFAIKAPFSLYYWITGLSGSKKQFAAPVQAMENKTYYNNYAFILGKVGWVVDDYATIKRVYRLHALETLPKGGSIEMLYGYQNGALNNRHYIGINCIKNITNSTLKYLHLSCESGSFIHKKTFEAAILKLALAYAGPSIQTCNGTRQFIAIHYIIGYRMPKERMLGIRRRDSEALEAPDDDKSMQAPIHARLNVDLDSTLHMPIMVAPIRFVCLGFAHFIALYNEHNALLNQTWVDRYGIGLQLEHVTMQWLTAALKIGYSPLLDKVVPSVQLAIRHFKNKTDPKPTPVAYH
ncbi:hypothetical protein [Cardinium endosymbiont of Oedothorax gibbosus]|uniref:hypothetical protein n=1 Tax=Cardinium endosymbiont of Oedothorax gibbosus TaxID=931101 RepID=UPI0020249C21|nr:hypothetical protein [Cardinium endosymbiont of Oedothorax gibbosus]CAH2559667.1 hypothetical protein CAOEGIBSW744_0121 [Cardinium endosymbiont of Oedothorax gibbosus]